MRAGERTSMSVIALYLLLLKATVTSFAGMGSLPQIRQDSSSRTRSLPTSSSVRQL